MELWAGESMTKKDFLDVLERKLMPQSCWWDRERWGKLSGTPLLSPAFLYNRISPQRELTLLHFQIVSSSFLWCSWGPRPRLPGLVSHPSPTVPAWARNSKQGTSWPTAEWLARARTYLSEGRWLGGFLSSMKGAIGSDGCEKAHKSYIWHTISSIPPHILN